MRTRTWLVGITSAAVLGTGALVGSALVTGSPTAAPATAAPSALTGFESCAALRDWYVDSALRRVGPYGWEVDGPIAIDAVAAGSADGSSYAGTARAAAPQGTLEGQTSSATGTNVQEVGVDEPDLAKTDGRRLVRITGSRVEVYDVTGATPRRTGTFALPDQSRVAPGGWELVLVGDTVVLLHSSWAGGSIGNGGGMVNDDVTRAPYREVRDETRVLTLRLTDGDPVVTTDRTWSGRVLAARQHGDVVRLVLQQGLPKIAFPMPAGAITGRTTPAQLVAATLRNQALVRATHVDDWVPTVRDTGSPTTDARPAVTCTDVLHPSRDAGPGTLTVVGLDPTGATSLSKPSSTAITTDGDQVYASADSLYVATSRYQGDSTLEDGAESFVAGRQRTELHRFDLSGTKASYVASGAVTGSLRDRWSMDAAGGRLRVAVEHTNAKGVSSSSVVVLAQDGKRLVETGRVDGLGQGEQIKSVRWFDDLAVVVTFRQTDPLYVLDLSDPDRPRLRGQLKVPGFSGYLHPIGQDRLLGLGSDADPTTGATRGGLAQVFDLSDRDQPRQTSRVVLPDLELTATYEPRTLTWTDAGVGYTSAYVQRDVQGPIEPGPIEPGPIEPGGGGGTSTSPELYRTTGPVSDLLTLRVVGGVVTTARTRLPGVEDPATVRTFALPDGRVALVTPSAVSYLP